MKTNNNDFYIFTTKKKVSLQLKKKRKTFSLTLVAVYLIEKEVLNIK